MLSLSILLVSSSTSMAFWLIYYEPAYKGRIVDDETKEPIEGAVVVAIYYSHTIIGGPAGGWTSIVNTREALTDEKGEFYISPYLTLFNPFNGNAQSLAEGCLVKQPVMYA